MSPVTEEADPRSLPHNSANVSFVHPNENPVTRACISLMHELAKCVVGGYYLTRRQARGGQRSPNTIIIYRFSRRHYHCRDCNDVICFVQQIYTHIVLLLLNTTTFLNHYF